MRTRPTQSLRPLLVLVLVLSLLAPWASAQQQGGRAYAQPELDQLLAPIALYPDALLAQILMASTYPLEVVEASRWSKANPSVKGKALEEAMVKQGWDPSVKSLTAFPQVLQMMNEKLDWTQKLGNAFLAQQQEVMSTVQSLRLKAQQAGTLRSSDKQKVVTEQGGGQTIIKIEPASPQVVYVPTYNPTVVYGAWPYPSYPPYYYYPPGYVAGTAALSFTTGLIVGAALWGNCNWGRNEVNINVNQYNSYNRTNISSTNWQHNAVHRRAVPYQNAAVQQRYGQGVAQNPQAREAFRGKVEQGQLGTASRPNQPGQGGASRATAAGQRPSAASPAAAGLPQRRRESAFEGIGQGGDVRNFSDRGRASRGEMQRPLAGGRPGGGEQRFGAGGGGRGDRPGAGGGPGRR